MNSKRALAGLCPAILVTAGCATTPKTASLPEITVVEKVAGDALMQDPTTPEPWVEYGRACILSDNYYGAIQALQVALEIDDKHAAAYEHLALAYSAVGQRDKALETCRRGLRADDQSPSLWLRYGYCLTEQGDFDAALDAFTEATVFASDDVAKASAMVGRAAVLRAQGREAEARAVMNAAAAISPEVEDLLSRHRAPDQ
jgi:tetratricopeptide (TPR) repeat protein